MAPPRKTAAQKKAEELADQAVVDDDVIDAEPVKPDPKPVPTTDEDKESQDKTVDQLLAERREMEQRLVEAERTAQKKATAQPKIKTVTNRRGYVTNYVESE